MNNPRDLVIELDVAGNPKGVGPQGNIRTLCPRCGAVWNGGMAISSDVQTCIMECCGARVHHAKVMLQRFDQIGGRR